MNDPVSLAVNQIIKRDEDDNLINEGLNELESLLFFKIESENHNCAVGESIMSAYRTEMAMKIAQTISEVVRKFEIENL